MAKPMFGCLGILRLISGAFLVLVAEREVVGEIGAAVIYKVTRTAMIPIPRAYGFANEEEVRWVGLAQLLTRAAVQRKVERNYLKVVNRHLTSNEFYYSHDYDLTRRTQVALLGNSGASLPLWQRADARFFWNAYLAQDFTSRQVLFPTPFRIASPHPCVCALASRLGLACH